MSALVVAANRGPVRLHVDEGARLATTSGAGGLAPSLSRALIGREASWVAAPMDDVERDVARGARTVTLDGGTTLRFIDASRESIDAAYRVVANSMLWFLHHGMFDTVHRPIFDARFYRAWELFRDYNASFARAIAAEASPGATVVVNDYHLSLVGAELSLARPDVATVHFSHTPFCSPSEVRILPDAIAAELITGLSKNGACGFHTTRWADAFLACAKEHGLSPPVFVAPLGVDARELSEQATSPATAPYRTALEDLCARRALVVRNDRIEPSKNIVRGFLAFEEFLANDPSWHDRVVFVARLYASREDLPEYLAYRGEIEHVVARINERFSFLERPPIVLAIGDDHLGSLATLASYDVLLVNALRDGMNLVAKEGAIVNERDGVLVLSREAGAFMELGDDSLAIAPFDISGTANALQQALSMTPEERHTRADRLAGTARRHSPANWLDALLAHARRAR